MMCLGWRWVQHSPHIFLAPGLDHDAVLVRQSDDTFHVQFEEQAVADLAHDWLAALSDGYVDFGDLYAKLDGPVVVSYVHNAAAKPTASGSPYADRKPFFVGIGNRSSGEALSAFTWEEPTDPPLKRTTLYETHVKLGGRIVPFAGYEMPVRYETSVGEEHTAVRTAAGLFDATHMGVFDAAGPHVVEFLNTVLTMMSARWT
ncbi:MAG: hypothetical protein HC804_10175 [Anaerolineae bacterium]|nr:hypothetical protein [Anaerolineae bacterium]